MRRATNFSLNSLTSVATHSLLYLNAHKIWRILKAEGLNRRPQPFSDRPARKQGTSRDHDLGFVHIDIKHSPKLQVGEREQRKCFLLIAIERGSRSVHLAVKNDKTEGSAIAFLREAAAAFPFRLTHMLTDNGSCFTPAFAKACADLKVQYCHTSSMQFFQRCYALRKLWLLRRVHPQTDGMVERFSGSISSAVLGRAGQGSGRAAAGIPV